MSEIQIITDHKWKPFRYRNEVPEKELKDRFDWLKEEEGYLDGFFKYTDNWYHICEFMILGKRDPFDTDEWDGYYSDSFFSGILIKTSGDGEMYKVGTYIS
jgi:hypothetical protein